MDTLFLQYINDGYIILRRKRADTISALLLYLHSNVYATKSAPVISLYCSAVSLPFFTKVDNISMLHRPLS